MELPRRAATGLYARNKVYEGVVGRESFGLWLHRLDKNVTEGVFDELVGEIPPEWYDDDLDSLLHLAEQLYRRRSNVPGLLLLFR